MIWSQIVSLRESVLCSQVQWLLHLDLAEQEQDLLNYIRSQFARFCTLYIDVCSRKRFARSMSSILLSDFRFLDFSAISRLSHFIGTSFGPPTIKSHKYWANETVTWDGRSEISVRHRWRCRMGHSTSRQCTLASIAKLRSRVLAPQCIFQSILGICCHIDATSHEKRTQNVGALETSMHSSYTSILFFAEACRNTEGWFVRFCSLRIVVWPD